MDHDNVAFLNMRSLVGRRHDHRVTLRPQCAPIPARETQHITTQ
jgi:hypothetical protein